MVMFEMYHLKSGLLFCVNFLIVLLFFYKTLLKLMFDFSKGQT